MSRFKIARGVYGILVDVGRTKHKSAVPVVHRSPSIPLILKLQVLSHATNKHTNKHKTTHSVLPVSGGESSRKGLAPRGSALVSSFSNASKRLGIRNVPCEKRVLRLVSCVSRGARFDRSLETWFVMWGVAIHTS